MRRRAAFSVNIAVLLFGLAGLFAKWIQILLGETPAIREITGAVIIIAAVIFAQKQAD